MDPPRASLEVMDMLAVRVALGSISARTLQRMVANRRFPKPFALTTQGKVWFKQDVEWFLWGRQIRTRMAKRPKAGGDHGMTTGDNARTTDDKRTRPVAK